MLPIIGVAMEVFHGPNHSHIVFDRVVNPVRKTLDKVTPDIIFDHAPNVRPLENDSNTRFHFIPQKRLPNPGTCWL